MLLGVENKRLVFFLTQSQISEESKNKMLIKYNIYLYFILRNLISHIGHY